MTDIDEARKKAIEKMRKRQEKKYGGSQSDPTEFRVPRLDKNESNTYYFHILPPKTEDDLWFVRHGSHFLEKRVHHCPRAANLGDCPLCALGFNLLEETDDKKERSDISKKYLSRFRYAMNVKFTDDKVNGEWAGKIAWLSVSPTVYDIIDAAQYRDNEGDDPNEPQAHGDFWNPELSYIFQLKVTEKGGWNNYDQSKFLASKGRVDILKGDKISLEELEAKMFSLPEKAKLESVDKDTLEDIALSMKHGPGYVKTESESSEKEEKKEEPKEEPKAEKEEKKEEKKEEPEPKAEKEEKKEEPKEEKEESSDSGDTESVDDIIAKIKSKQ